MLPLHSYSMPSSRPRRPAVLADLPTVLYSRAVTALLVTSCVLALLVSAIVAGPPLLQQRALVVTSGSMEPAVHVGDAVVMKNAKFEDLASGDLIVMRQPLSSTLRTHRVVEAFYLNGQPYVRTKGDANPEPDPDLTPVAGISGRVTAVLPKTGYLMQFANRPIGGLLIFALPLLILAGRELAGPYGARR
jgi:signal peptidase I